MKRLSVLVVAALMCLSVASAARAQQPTFAMLGTNGCSGATPYGNASWCFDAVSTVNPGIWWNNAGTFTQISGSGANLTVGELTIKTGITASSAGYNAFTIASPVCTTSGAGGACAEPTHTFSPTGFIDANYFINCTCTGSLTAVPVVEGVSKASNAVVVTIAGITAVSASCPTIDCVAIHQ